MMRRSTNTFNKLVCYFSNRTVKQTKLVIRNTDTVIQELTRDNWMRTITRHCCFSSVAGMLDDLVRIGTRVIIRIIVFFPETFGGKIPIFLFG